MKVGNRWISLKALHTFEVVARHVHMGKAAEELNVTQSAVSHQIKSLENSLGTALFEREGRGVSITPAGLRLKKSVQKGLNGISATALSLQNNDVSGNLTIMMPASFLNEWLVEKLEVFLDNFPMLSLRLKVSGPNPQTIPSDVDLAIVFDAFDFPGRVVLPLHRVRVFPVCAPKLAHDLQTPTVDILKNEVLVHEDDGTLWSEWFAANGIEQSTPRRHIHAGSLQNAMLFARRGIGLALTDQLFSIEDFRAGTLIKPFGEHSFRESQYYIVARSDEPEASTVNTFSLWLRRAVQSEDRLA